MADPNPNPSRITAEMWWLWVQLKALIPGVRLGGIFADKSGYHNTVLANLARWPGNYSVRHAIDREQPRDKARAIDLTMNSTWMRTITRRLLDGAARRDPRMRCVKEFYGTTDGRTVVGRLKDSPDGPYREGSSDSSHTWHEHLGLLTPFVDDIEAMRGLVSLLSGQSLADYMEGTMERIIAEHGDSGPWVAFVQRYLQDFGATLTRDSRYGDETTAAAKWVFVHRFGGDPAAYNGRSITDWMLREFIRRDQDQRTAAAIKAAIAGLRPSTAPTQAQVDAAVAKYLDANPVPPGKTPTEVTIQFPPVKGTVTASR